MTLTTADYIAFAIIGITAFALLAWMQKGIMKDE